MVYNIELLNIYKKDDFNKDVLSNPSNILSIVSLIKKGYFYPKDP